MRLRERTTHTRFRCGLYLLIVCLASISCGAIADTGEEVEDSHLSAYLRARKHYAAGRFAEAERELRALTAVSPQLFQAELLLAQSLYFQGKSEEAERRLRHLRKANPCYQAAGLWLARLLRHRGEYAQAGEILDTMLRYDPRDPRLLYLRALVYESKGETEESLASLRKAALFREEYARVYIDLGRLYHRLGVRGQALANLETALALLPRTSSMRPGVKRVNERIRSATGSSEQTKERQVE
jgi:tetratricopeptide (TPR) repeat protein